LRSCPRGRIVGPPALTVSGKGDHADGAKPTRRLKQDYQRSGMVVPAEVMVPRQPSPEAAVLQRPARAAYLTLRQVGNVLEQTGRYMREIHEITS